MDLNSLLYKYENDLAFILANCFNDKLEGRDGKIHTSEIWIERAKERKKMLTSIFGMKKTAFIMITMFMNKNKKIMNQQRVSGHYTRNWPQKNKLLN